MPVRSVNIPKAKGKVRRLAIPTLRDGVVQAGEELAASLAALESGEELLDVQEPWGALEDHRQRIVVDVARDEVLVARCPAGHRRRSPRA
jgi:hypothetical protein